MIAITGASGKLGHFVIQHLLNKIETSKIVAIVRDEKKALELSKLGIKVRLADYNSSENLEVALQGVERLLLISSNEIGQRLKQHTNVINAAKKAGVNFIAYTSILNADTSIMKLAQEHIETENIIKSSKMTYAILRNSWYIENYTDQIETYLQHGAIVGSTKNQKISMATRSDYALAAAAVLIAPPEQSTIYELGGEAISLSELSTLLSAHFQKTITYNDVPVETFKAILIGAGLPEAFSDIFSQADLGIARGDLYTKSDELEKLIGRKPTTISFKMA